MENVTIVGTGPAGLTAAIYTARAGLKPVIYAGVQHGGQLTTTTEVENFPGFAEGIMGPQLMADMTTQAERMGARVIYEEITSVDFTTPTELKLTTSTGKTFESKTAIISTGATARTMGLPGEKELMGRGLSTCATCDGFFYRGKKVIVVGGGDSAMEEASYLANLAAEVTLVHRRSFFRASDVMHKRVENNEKINLMVPWTITETIGDNTGLTKVVLENTENGEKKEMEIDGVFYAIGHDPNSQLFKDFVDVDDHGFIKVEDFVKTRTPGVYAAGDIADPTFKQAITAAGMGCQAGITAARFIEDQEG
ncbi:thioredoxin-disulfide reductase [bacterium]|nr:thioredoxin-disulfide reductase [bacterium]